MSDPLRLIIYDATQKRRPQLGSGLRSRYGALLDRGLGLSWQLGTSLYRGRHLVDGAHGAADFASALSWLRSHEPSRQIGELQFWGHGKWGAIFIDREPLDRSVLQAGHVHHRAFQRFRERLTPNALIWFRSCETLGALAGHDLACALGDATGARIAGHTYVIGFFQSGLHCLKPGHRPSWSAQEGLALGTARDPKRALPSSPLAPNTITCLTGHIPEDF